MIVTLDVVWHFPIMIIASFIIFYGVVRIVLGKQEFLLKLRMIIWLSFIVVVLGMLIGKYGANYGFKWWVYYTIPALVNVLLPPIILKMDTKQLFTYLGLSTLSAPTIHVLFSFFLNWGEYMPFWKIPYILNFT